MVKPHMANDLLAQMYAVFLISDQTLDCNILEGLKPSMEMMCTSRLLLEYVTAFPTSSIKVGDFSRKAHKTMQPTQRNVGKETLH